MAYRHNNMDTATLLSIAKNRNKLMKLAEGIKTRKKSGNKKSLNLKRDPAYTNIEHLVFGTYRPRAATPDEQFKNETPDGGRTRVNTVRPNTDTKSDTANSVSEENMSPHRRAIRNLVHSKVSVENGETDVDNKCVLLEPVDSKQQNCTDLRNSDGDNHVWKVSIDSNSESPTDKWITDNLLNDSVFADESENVESSCTWNIDSLDHIKLNLTEVNPSEVHSKDSSNVTNGKEDHHQLSPEGNPRTICGSVSNGTTPVKEQEKGFVRQNTYPSGIPRPRIHVKHTLTPMKNPILKSCQQQRVPTNVKSIGNTSVRKPLEAKRNTTEERSSTRPPSSTKVSNRCTVPSKSNICDMKTKSSSRSSLSSSHSSLSGSKGNGLQTKKAETVRGFVRNQSYCRQTDKSTKSNGIVRDSAQIRKGVPRPVYQNKAVTKSEKSSNSKNTSEKRTLTRNVSYVSSDKKEKNGADNSLHCNDNQQNQSFNSLIERDQPKSIPRHSPEGSEWEKGSKLPTKITQNDRSERSFRRPMRSVSVDSGKVLNARQLSAPSPVKKSNLVRNLPNGNVPSEVQSSLKKSSTVDIGSISHKSKTPEHVEKPKINRTPLSQPIIRRNVQKVESGSSNKKAENSEKNIWMSDIEEKDENSSSSTKTPAEDNSSNHFGPNRRATSLPKSFLLEKGKKSAETRSKESLGLERLLQFGENSQVEESPALIRRRAASTSESSPKTKPPPRPHSDVGSSLNGNSSVVEAFMAQMSRQRDNLPELKRHSSDSGTPLKKTPSVERQLSTPSFIKMRTDRSRPIKRRGHSRLHRSISQPLDLEKVGLNTRTIVGFSDHEGSRDISTASSEDDFSSDGEDSHISSRNQTLFREFSDDGITYAEALWDHVTIDAEELAFQAGEVIEVTDSSDKDWWWGSIGTRSGWFPAAFVRLRVNQEDTVEDCISKMNNGTLMQQVPRKMSVSLLSNEQVRANVVKEIVSTEKDFVQHLKDVVEGYLRQVRRRSDMFSDECIATIFGNIEEVYHFQSGFLKHLESCIDMERPHLSQIGNCFLKHKDEFEIYSEYCNNHPLAVSELQELYADSKYIHFFEACRLLQEMIDISLDGFLLTPVQKICKYPLQLAELLKYTKTDHPDFQPVTKALAAMREVAQLVNERKRRMECLERLTEWQQSIDGWEGPDLLDTSSMLLHSGEVTRAPSTWSRDLIHLFLFDHLIIYCKKDLLKRNTYVYKGRIDLDDSCVIDLEDGKDLQFGVTVKNAWKVYCATREKWFLFYTKTPSEKEQWLQSFKEERKRVKEDKLQGYVVTEEAKKAARLAVINKFKPKRPRAKLVKGSRPHPDTAVAELLLDPPEPKSRTGSLPSNLHPSVAVSASARHGLPKKKGSGWFHFGSSKKPKK
ncbi:rhoGEF domain-containing protein gxcJ-like isoform X1 [Centruroides vittatus]|uniref:rhoGEF domain-containing protein gxcJ-like isoform X1 n=1 Tax=Centruroides vittatus TaxID=120091 RepID=UPI003510CB89